jgi:hypothetical protein
MDAAVPARPTRLVGVYRADGSLRGEIAYVVGHLLGRTHCALCDVTHSPVRRKAGWDRMVARLGVPFELVHMDERDAATRAVVVTWDDAPAVLVEVDGDLTVLLRDDEIDAVHGDVDGFEALLRSSLAARGLAVDGSAEDADDADDAPNARQASSAAEPGH